MSELLPTLSRSDGQAALFGRVHASERRSHGSEATNVDHSNRAAAPKPTRKTQEELDEEAASAPISEKLLKVGKAYLIGKRTFIDYEQRALEDEDDGTTRLTDANYHRIVEMGNAEDVWIIIMWVSLSLISRLLGRLSRTARRCEVWCIEAHKNIGTVIKPIEALLLTMRHIPKLPSWPMRRSRPVWNTSNGHEWTM